MKRWMVIVAMAPVMWGLLQMVIGADRLHAWQYSPEFAPPTEADFNRSAIAFWSALLTPICAGLVAAVVAFRRKDSPCWSVLEAAIIAFPYVVVVTGELSGVLYEPDRVGTACWRAIMGAYLVVGGAVVSCLLNLGACMRMRAWRKFSFCAVVLCAGMLYLLWWNAFIIYVDT